MKLVFSCIIIVLLSCSSKKEVSTKLPYQIESVYFQKWIGGQEQTGSGINFYIQFKSPLPENKTLAKLYFQEKEGFFEKEDETHYIARFYSKPQNQELIMDGDSTKEYGNKAPEITKARFELQPNEAVLEFHNGNDIEHYKIVDVKEKELLAYPSTRPRN
jgi:hypothetical protein